MMLEDIIEQLEDLRTDFRVLLPSSDHDPNNAFRRNIETLGEAISILRGIDRQSAREASRPQENYIKTLKACMELFLFDPMHGETSSPESMSGSDREFYDAIKYAVTFLETHPRTGKNNYYFTFGSDSRFPLGIEEYVEVHADTTEQAVKKFQVYFPNREGSDLVNCAFIYSENTWKGKVYPESYYGKKPTMVIE